MLDRMLTRTRVRAALAALTAVLVLPLLTSSAGAATAQFPAHPAPATFTVSGAVNHPLTLNVGDLRRYQAQREWVSFGSSAGQEHHIFRGALLFDVLTAAAPSFDPASKNDKLSFAVVVTGTDGYRSTLSWAEFDPDFGAGKDLLAFDQDHQGLTRPRLVVPGDGKGGRYVSDIASITVLALGR
jgi:hypothetical protein